MTEPVHRLGQKTAGAWGLHTATIDWCEDNYTHTHYVAEWYNTISNIPFILLGLFGAYSFLAPHLQPNRKPIPDGTRHAAGNIGIMCIGFGSAYFTQHSSGMPSDRWKGQNSWKLKIGLAAVPLTVSAFILPEPNFAPSMLRNYPVNIDIPDRPSLPYCPTLSPTNRPTRSETLHHHRLLTLRLAFGIWNVDNVWCDTWTLVRSKAWGLGGGIGELVGAMTRDMRVASFDWVRMRKNRSWDVLKYPGAFELTTPVWGLVPAIRWRVMGGKGGLGANAKMDKLQ
ncbi:Ceramidase [Rhizoctonia solani]|uniref:Ceramidase n=1 Tax=Rhizoctonia solani TaxID=456999 RepID=A0A8H7I3S5_9AGAM|nr:Ceramidase [Rhizoctonia solani]